MESRIRRSTGTQVVTGAGPGRPPGPPGSQRTARLVVRVTPADVAAYQAAAGRAGVSMGEWVRGRLVGDGWEPALAPRLPAAAKKEHGG